MEFTASEIFQDFTVVAIPTKTSFRGITTREVALFRGPAGWSEFSPFLEYGRDESRRWLMAAVEAATHAWPEQKRTSIPINATLPRVAVDQVPRILKNFPGISTIKIKVDSFEKDADLVEAALEYAPDAKIRLDVNGGWTLPEALLNLHDFHLRFGAVFEYIEQPCESRADLAALKKEIPMKIAVDESIRKSLHEDFSTLNEIADVAIIKWAPSGGFAEAKKLIAAIGLPVVVSSALDTGIGISHGLALAGSLDTLDYACGLGTVSLFESDICTPAVTVANGEISIHRREPDPALLAKYRATGEREEWWKNRISQILEGGSL